MNLKVSCFRYCSKAYGNNFCPLCIVCICCQLIKASRLLESMIKEVVPMTLLLQQAINSVVGFEDDKITNFRDHLFLYTSIDVYYLSVID